MRRRCCRRGDGRFASLKAGASVCRDTTSVGAFVSVGNEKERENSHTGKWTTMTIVAERPEDSREREIARIANVINEEFKPYYAQLEESFDRVRHLLSSADRLRVLGPQPSAADDVLRSAVVLTHACLEDFLRTLISRMLPEGDECALRDIPLAGTGRGKPQFHLGQLAQHRQKTVDAVIRESIAEFLDRTTFNNTTEIAQVLELLRLNVKQVERNFSGLNQMIGRRHQIVHRSDRLKGTSTLEPIHASQVQDWLKATKDFTIGVVSSIAAESVVKVLKAQREGRVA